ncbi:MAG TPA: DUF6141 family protein [Longimicrobiales bacterium]|nr:DUF6141 family protein [Longimicrobiales bacterium]
MTGRRVLFREIQRFTQPWLWLLLGGSSLMIWYGAWRQLAMGQPFGSNPAPDGWLVVLLLVFGVGFPLFFLWLRLETEVTTEGLGVRFFPLHLRRRAWNWDEIEVVERRAYSPMLEYGGWGIRMGVRGWAYNVRGNDGVQLVLRSGERILIGTQDGDALMAAVARARAAR